MGDLWNNGRISAVIANRNAAPSLLVNQTKYSNHWMDIRTVGTRSNRSGIGARVTVNTASRRQISEVRSGSSYISHSDLRIHFGLGRANVVTSVEVRWPSGLVEQFASATVDAIMTVEEGTGQPLRALGGHLPKPELERRSRSAQGAQ